VAIPVAWQVPSNESLHRLAASPLRGALEFLKYILYGSGILSIPIQVLSLFVRGSSLDDDTSRFIGDVSPKSAEKGNATTVPNAQVPEIEIMSIATSAIDDLEEHKRSFAKIGVFTLLTCLLQPKSRGTVRLASLNPHDRPRVDLGLLHDPADFAMGRKAVRLALRLGDTIKAKGFPLLRGVAVPVSEQESEGLDQFIRHRTRTTYHYSGTCRMASEFDARAPGVVDDSLRVHGVSNLRVCDASVFPQIIASHLQAPVAMVAEKCASMIQASRGKE